MMENIQEKVIFSNSFGKAIFHGSGFDPDEKTAKNDQISHPTIKRDVSDNTFQLTVNNDSPGHIRIEDEDISKHGNHDSIKYADNSISHTESTKVIKIRSSKTGQK